MKAKTYARLALLIPLLLWGILLLVELLITAVVPADLMSDGPNTFFGLLTILLFSYVLGILFWLIPYSILSITLLLISFKSRLETLQYLIALSPFAMAILVMVEVTSISLAGAGMDMPSTDLMASFKDGVGINLFVGVIAVVWGYLCVGLGFGGFKLLQRFGKIKEQEKTSSEITNLNSQEA